MSQYRTPTAYVLGVLVLLAVIVLTTPNGGTHARWSATALAEVPTMTTGRIGFEITAVEGAGGAATLTSTSGFDVRYRPVQVSLVDSAGRSVAAPAGMRFAYRTGAACDDGAAPAEWTATAPGGSAPARVDGGTRASLEHDRPAGLCLTVSTDAVAEDALRALDGQVLQVVTVVEASTLGAGTWSTTRSWTAPFTNDFPDATAPLRLRCTPVSGDTKSVRLSWTGGPAQVSTWELYAHRQGTPEPQSPVTSTDGRVTGVSLSRDLLTAGTSQANGSYTVWVQPGSAGTPSTGDRSSSIKVGLQGINLNCEGLPS